MRPPSAVSGKQFEEALAQLDKQLKNLELRLTQQRNRYEVESAYKPAVEKARIALKYGLAETALDLLQKVEKKEELAEVRGNAPPGVQLGVELLLGLGRLDEARDILTPPADSLEKFNKDIFGMHLFGLPAWDWFEVQLAAASGDYETADRALAEAMELIEKRAPYVQLLVELRVVDRETWLGKPMTPGMFSAILLGDVLLDRAVRATRLPYRGLTALVQVPWDGRLELGRRMLANVNQQRANLMSLRAWLSLESGHVDRAREQALQAITTGQGDAPKGFRLLMDFAGRPLAYLVLQRTESPRTAKRKAE
jgi:tetratricopeptide (TPR) repeat protein